jgi:hypothetical protein
MINKSPIAKTSQKEDENLIIKFNSSELINDISQSFNDDGDTSQMMSALLEIEGLKIIQNLRKNIIADNLYKFKSYLFKLYEKNEVQKLSQEFQSDFFLKSGISKTITIVKDYVFHNLNNSNLYSLFSAFKDLLISIKEEENLKFFLKIENSKINDYISILDDAMQATIHKQIKMKNSRRNLKTKLRLQRKLNEMQNQLEILEKLNN